MMKACPFCGALIPSKCRNKAQADNCAFVAMVLAAAAAPRIEVKGDLMEYLEPPKTKYKGRSWT